MLIVNTATWMKSPSLGLFLPVPSHGGGSKGRLSIPLRLLLSHHVRFSSAAAALARKAMPPGPAGTLRLAVCRAGRAARPRHSGGTGIVSELPFHRLHPPLEKQPAVSWGGIYSLEIPRVLCTLLHCILTHVQTAAFLPFLFHFTRNNPRSFDSLHFTSKPVFFLLPPLGCGVAPHICTDSSSFYTIYWQTDSLYIYSLFTTPPGSWDVGWVPLSQIPLFALRAQSGHEGVREPFCCVFRRYTALFRGAHTIFPQAQLGKISFWLWLLFQVTG